MGGEMRKSVETSTRGSSLRERACAWSRVAQWMRRETSGAKFNSSVGVGGRVPGGRARPPSTSTLSK